jgi:2-polyprenyl-3-methyl-5-hydroxy-6-metoxy-1,4-benzoquinol methylase
MGKGEGLGSYIIKGGDEGRARLSVLARVLAPTTEKLFDRFEPLGGLLAIDAGCGGGDVSFELAERVGAGGRVIGIDLDNSKIAAARLEAGRRGYGHVEFHAASVLDLWPTGNAALVYARFVLTHLARPEDMLARAMGALAPGGLLVVEDIDFDGHFCDPPCPAFDRYLELYAAAAARRGADAFIGRRLVRLLDAAGFRDVDSSLAQPYGRAGEVKQIASLTFAAVSETLVTSSLATAGEVAEIAGELKAFAERPDSTLSLPRVFQAWGRRAGAVPAARR